MNPWILGPLFVLSITGALRALPQEPDQTLPVSKSVFDGAGLTNLGGELIGNGPDYEAWFADAGFTLTPALGDRASVQRLSLRLATSGRRHGPVRSHEADGVHPKADGLVVRYVRDGLTEVYEVRTDGVKQSFLFDRLPPGSGDLVVRLVVDTELPLAHASAGELRFELDGIGGVRIGEVVGVDAAGRRATGSMAYRDGELELALPAAFVDTAALPLELDPLLGSTLNVGAASQNDEFPDAAFDFSWDRYLVVWQRNMGRNNYSIIGQLITSTGNPIQGSYTIRNNIPDLFSRPRVANVNSRDTFVVAWQENEDIRASAFPAAGNPVSLAAELVAGGSNKQWSPAVGGDATTRDDDALVTWFDFSAKRIMAARLEVASNGSMRAHDITTLRSHPEVKCEPDISRGGGIAGRHLIVWGEGTPEDVYGVIVDNDLRVLTSVFAVTSSRNGTQAPAVDGDGTNWIVAYEREFAQGGDEDIACRGVSFDANQSVGFLSPREIIVEGNPNDPELRPSVGWLGDSALIAFHDWNSPNYDTFVVSVDPFDCDDCEGEFGVDVSTRNNWFVQIATEKSGGGGSNDALLVWGSESTTTSDSDVMAVRFRGDHGLTAQVGPGCAGGGAAHAACGIVPNSGFELRLRQATPNSPAFLLLAAGAANVPICGSCNMGVDPLTSVSVGVGLTDGFGNAAVALSIPNLSTLVGATLFEQWVVATSLNPCPLKFSPAISVRLQKAP